MLSKNPAAPRKSKDRRPGKKSALPPRVPAYRKLPNLERVNFADDNILGILIRSGMAQDEKDYNVNAAWSEDAFDRWFQAHPKKKSLKDPRQAFAERQANLAALTAMKDPQFDRDLFAEITQKKQIHEEIAQAVSSYISALGFAMRPVEFRRAIKRYSSALKNIKDEIATTGHSVYVAIKDELRSMDGEVGGLYDRLDLTSLTADLDKLLAATNAIVDAESGGGRDAKRAAYELMTALANIFESYTGKQRSRGNAGIRQEGEEVMTTPFGRFVAAVNDRIPDGFKLTGLDNLVRQNIATTRPAASA
jgi:hypothetical protein